MRFCFPKAVRLRTRWDYRRVAKSHRRLTGDLLVLEVRNNGTSITKLGITLTRKFGKSHERNRVKRIVKEAFRLSYPQLNSGLDIHVRPLVSSKNACTGEMIQEFLKLVGTPHSE